MATAYVVKGYGKGYVAMNPWRYTQVSAEATSFSKIPAAVSFVRLNLPKMFQEDKFCVVKRTSGAVVMTDLAYDAKAVLKSSGGQVEDNSTTVKGKRRMYYKVEQQFEDKKNSLRAFIDSMDDSGTLSMEMSQIDKELEDMKHYIEFSCLNAADGYKAFKKMQDILLKRRTIKDKMNFAQVLEQRKIDKSSLQAVLTYLENMGNRSYEVRTDTGLFSDLTDITPNK